ncbi:phosphate regulon transcriptional regulator PhoB [Nitrosomonas eutropha]|uniref:Phosphate regulon transcriptional regulatory protein PhoB n=2 Tax=Nitrosomonas eutropha TaxID=916 RepID=A0ABX5M9A0_9PROT|nr:phosphate regulon transcriptional regulator PhoB [Nitrosomonas eutropha]ABI60305.1 two component transcriptional regulator, winged helix family [Nitrosomonas eutropha C91]PXV83709.1 winged helix family two component transcriptional regulator [Nitrosomonas eutropha]SEI53343.1 two component transcriptional regulator, winged helix family [Nitrosomonas eutropha]
MSATVLVVEDEPAIQELIAYNLRNANYIVVCVNSAEQAVVKINEILPDLILLDWMLLGKSGIEFARSLRRDPRTRSIPVIMLTARVEEGDKVSGLEAGADDYITKPFSPRELIARIKAVLRRSLPEASDEILNAEGVRLNPMTHRVTVINQEDGFREKELLVSPTEFRLLHFLMAHAERVHTRAQLLDRVWGDHVFVEDRTVDVHIRRLRKVLEVAGKADLIQTVRGAGYRFSTRNEDAF